MKLTPPILYFAIAFLTQLLLAEHPPADWFSYLKWLGMALLQGLIALKALHSNPPPPPPKSEAPSAITAALEGGGSP